MRSPYLLLGALIGALALTATASPAASTPSPNTPIFAVAGNSTACSTPPACGDGAAATGAQLSLPEGVAVDALGNAYLADWGDNEVRRVAPDGTISTIAGGGTPCWSPPGCGDGAAATDAELSFPQGVAVGPDGSVYIADTGDNEIRRVTPGGKITRFAGTGADCARPPACGDGGPASAAQLSAPAGVAVDRAGAVYVADTGDSEIRKISPSGTISRIAGTGVFCAGAPSCGDGGSAASAQLNFPGGVAVDTAGDVYIADAGDNEVRKVSPSGAITRVAGSGKQCSSPPACGDGGSATSGDLSEPDGVAIAASGNLYIADGGDNEVRVVTAAGKIGAVAGNGTACALPSSCGAGGPAASAQVDYPDAIALDPTGDLYIVDTYDNQLRWLSSAGTTTLTTGTGKVAFSAFAAGVSSASVVVRYALSAPASVILSVTSGGRTTVVAHATAHPGFGALAWNRRIGSATAPRGRYTMTVTATAGGQSATAKLNIRLS